MFCSQLEITLESPPAWAEGGKDCEVNRLSRMEKRSSVPGQSCESLRLGRLGGAGAYSLPPAANESVCIRFHARKKTSQAWSSKSTK